MKSEARPQAFIEFESLAATIPDIVYRIDEDGKFTFLNTAIRKLGYEPNDLIGKHFSTLILPADIKSVSRKYILPNYIGKVGSGSPKLFDERRGIERKTSQLEVRLLSKGGARAISGKIKDIGSHQIIAEVSSSGVYRNGTNSQDGVFLGTVGIISDITRQRWMEAALIRYSGELEKQIKENKEISTVILESSPIGLFIVSNNEFQFANKSFLKITGYTFEQLKGRNVLDLVVPDDREIVRLSAISMLKHGISYPYEYRAIDINKNIHWIRGMVASIYYKGKRAILGNFIDVTDRKQAEEHLIQSERKYATLVENSLDGIAIIKDGLIAFENSRMSKITGMSNEDAAGKTFLDFVSPGFRGVFREMYEKRFLGQDVPNDFELELISHTGENITVEMTLSLITHEEARAVMAVVRDISEKKKRDEALFLRGQLLDKTSDGVIALDKEINVIYVNEAWCRMHGYSVPEIVGNKLFNILKPQRDIIPLDQIEESGDATYETLHTRKDGSTFPVEVHMNRINVNGSHLAIGIIRDITERKKVQSELGLRLQLLDSVAEAIYVFDEKHNCVYVNDAACRIGDFKREELTGKNIFHMLPKDFEKVNVSVDRILSEQGEIISEGVVVHRTKHDIPAEIHARLINIGGQLYIIAISRDITERKKAELMLRESYNNLRQTFIGITKAISATIELRDAYTAGHQMRVGLLAKGIAEEMLLTDEQASQIYTAGLIHDIGKISVPAEILSKPGKLNDIEFSLIKSHPLSGYNILNNIDFPYPIARWVLEHHERLDGSGYPNGLKAEQISIEAKILAVADVVEAMASHRPYRPSLNTDMALNEIAKNKGTLYDNDVVDACLRLFYEKGFKFE